MTSNIYLQGFGFLAVPGLDLQTDETTIYRTVR